MKTLLLVDDSRAVRMAERRIVSNFGLNVLEAENGQEALNVLQSAREGIDAILLDWNMPVMDGISFLRALRQDGRLAQPTVLMCTTENDISRISEALQAGANEYIMKPFTEEIVRGKLHEAGVI